MLFLRQCHAFFFKKGKHNFPFLTHPTPSTSSNIDITLPTYFRSESHYCPEHEKLMQAYKRTARKTLEFKPELKESADSILKEVSARLGRRPNEVFFVGVHNRRTDHIEWTKKNHNRKPLKGEFFYDAMDEFR